MKTQIQPFAEAKTYRTSFRQIPLKNHITFSVQEPGKSQEKEVFHENRT